MDGKPNFAAIKKQVSMLDLLTRLVPTYSYEPTTETGELRGKCPFGDCNSARSFTYNTTKNVFNCFACKRKGSVLDFIKFAKNLGSLVEAARYIEREILQKPEPEIQAGEPKQEHKPSDNYVLIDRQKLLEVFHQARAVSFQLMSLTDKARAIDRQASELAGAANVLCEELRALVR